MTSAGRNTAVATMAALADSGVGRTVMVTGDAWPTARHIAGLAGITEVWAECRPEDKVAIVRDLAPKPVLMVGDGINDAPVLAAADVGLAMGARGSTAASESADVVIMVDDLGKTATAVVIGQDTVRIAVQSIWAGISLSLVLMAVAATGLLPAVAGALSQEAVDLATILYALRALAVGRREADPVPAPQKSRARGPAPEPH